MRKSGQATASVSPTKFDVQTYQELLLDVFDEETQEDLNTEKSSDDDDDDDDDDDKKGGNRTDENNGTEKEDSNGDKIMQGNGAEEEEQENKTPPPSPNKAPPSPMHTDQADTQPAASKGAPASPMNDHDADSISRDEDSPPTPAQESHHTIPAQVTITVTDPGPYMACTLDHESPGFVHEGAMQRIPHPTQEQRKWTYHVHDLSRVTDHWKTTTELDGDPERESVMEVIASWAHNEARQKDPSELDPDKHIKWLTNAYLYFKSCKETKWQKATDILKSLFTEQDTRYHLTALARNTRIAQVPAIDATIKRTPTVPIPDITGRPELEIIMRKIQSSWPINHEFILEASIVEFLLAFFLHAKIAQMDRELRGHQ